MKMAADMYSGKCTSATCESFQYWYMHLSAMVTTIILDETKTRKVKIFIENFYVNNLLTVNHQTSTFLSSSTTITSILKMGSRNQRCLR